MEIASIMERPCGRKSTNMDSTVQPVNYLVKECPSNGLPKSKQVSNLKPLTKLPAYPRKVTHHYR